MTSEPAESSAAIRTGRYPAAKAALGLLVLVGIATALLPLARERLGLLPAPEAPAGMEVENLRAEVSALALRVAQLEARPQGVAAAPAPATAEVAPVSVPVSPDMDTLAKQIAELKRSSADAAAVMRLADRLEKTESALREVQAKRASAAQLLLAAGQLREAVNHGMAYDPEWRALKLLAGEEAGLAAALETLKDKAQGGIMTRSALAHGFETLAPRLIRAEILPAEEGWGRTVSDRLLALVTVRREDGSAHGVSAPAVVARAQAALGRGDLAAATQELDILSEGPGKLAAPWLAEAKARVAADRALSELVAQCLAQAGAKP